MRRFLKGQSEHEIGEIFAGVGGGGDGIDHGVVRESKDRCMQHADRHHTASDSAASVITSCRHDGRPAAETNCCATDMKHAALYS